jgi:hypothetical protein
LQHCPVEGEGFGKVDLLQGEQAVFAGIERATVGLADHPAHGEHDHVSWGRRLVRGKGRKHAEGKTKRKKHAFHDCPL